MSNEIKKVNDNDIPRYRQASDILEREDGFHIFMDMPGVAKEGLDIDLKTDELIVTGTSNVFDEDDCRCHDIEFGNIEYRRAFKLSDVVDRSGIKAHLDNGVLELHLPKAEKAQPKRIEISAG